MNAAAGTRTMRLRTMVRAGQLAFATAWWFAAFLLLWLPWPTRRRRAHVRDLAMQRWARSVVRVLCVRVVVEGDVPTGPLLLVANHVSYVDVPVLASLRPLSFLAKSEVARWPGLGAIARAVGVQFVVRGDTRALPEVDRRLHDEVRAGHAVAFFPEGTSSDGSAVLPFRPALLEQAATKAMPVHHAAISYATPPGSPPPERAVAWWGDMTFVPHLLALLALPEIEARVVFAREPVQATDRKELARALQRGVERDLAGLRRVQEGGGRKSFASSRNVLRLSNSPRPRL